VAALRRPVGITTRTEATENVQQRQRAATATIQQRQIATRAATKTIIASNTTKPQSIVASTKSAAPRSVLSPLNEATINPSTMLPVQSAKMVRTALDHMRQQKGCFHLFFVVFFIFRRYWHYQRTGGGLCAN
jgi:hypothetical protein